MVLDFKSDKQKIVLTCSITTGVVALLVLMGWQFNIAILKSVLPGFLSMKPNAAICFGLVSVALFCLRFDDVSQTKKLIGFSALAGVLLICVLTLAEYLWNIDFGIDELLFVDRDISKYTAFQPGRLAPVTGLCFCLLSIGAFLNFSKNKLHRVGQAMYFIILIISIQAMLNYFFGINNSFGIPFYIRMPLHTVALFVVSCIGFLFIHPHKGLMTIITAEGLGGRTARRLLVPAVCIPAFVHWLQYKGINLGLFDENFGAVLKIMGNIVLFSIIIWRNAAIIHDADIQRIDSDSAKLLSDKHLQEVNEKLPQLMFAISPEGSVTYVNQLWTSYTGKTLKDMQRQNFNFSDFHADEVEVALKQWQEACASGKLFDNILRLRRADEVYRWHLLRTFPLKNEKNEIIKWIATCSDVDDRKRAQLSEDRAREENLVNVAILNSEARFKAIFNSALGSIISIDREGKFVDWNKHAETMFGWTKEEILGKKMSETIIPADLRQGHQNGMQHYEATGHGPILNKMVEVEAIRRSGERFPIQLSVAPVKLSNTTIFTAFIVDITERKKIEHLKNEFISIVSHELRTPLTSIRGSLGLVASGAMGEVSTKAKMLIDIAHSNSERLSRLINDILDIEKIESGGMTFNNVNIDLNDVVYEAVEAHASFAEKYKVKFKVIGNIPHSQINGDQDRLMQVFANLLSNAAKFSPEGANIEIGAKEYESSVHIWIQDFGPGIPEEFKTRIFGKFTQADSSDTRQKDGTGLGLNISRAIIEKLQGRIWFESEVGKGTKFIFELPLHSEEHLVNPAIKKTHSFESSKSILLIPKVLHVEDDCDVAKIVTNIVGSSCEVTSAVDIYDARQKLAEKHFDLAVLDLKLPDGSALDLIWLIKDRLPECKIIVFSAFEINDTRLNVVDCILVKSRTSNSQLFTQVSRLLGIKNQNVKLPA